MADRRLRPCPTCGADSEPCPPEATTPCGLPRPDSSGLTCIKVKGHGGQHRAVCSPAPLPVSPLANEIGAALFGKGGPFAAQATSGPAKHARPRSVES